MFVLKLVMVSNVNQTLFLVIIRSRLKGRTHRRAEKRRQCNLFTPKPGNYFVASEKEAWAVLAGSKMTTEYVRTFDGRRAGLDRDDSADLPIVSEEYHLFFLFFCQLRVYNSLKSKRGGSEMRPYFYAINRTPCMKLSELILRLLTARRGTSQTIRISIR